MAGRRIVSGEAWSPIAYYIGLYLSIWRSKCAPGQTVRGWSSHAQSSALFVTKRPPVGCIIYISACVSVRAVASIFQFRSEK